MKKTTRLFLSLVAMVFISSTAAFSQFTQMWMQQYRHTPTNNYSSESRKVVEDNIGCIYVLTDNTSDLDSNGIQTGTHHYTVVSKYTSTGGKLQKKAIEVFNHISSGSDNLGAFGLEIDANANIYVGYTPYSANGNYNVAVMKLDSSLNNIIWNSQYGTPASDVGVDMKLSATGMVYFVAKTTNGGNTTYSVLKTNSGTAPTVMYSFTPNTDVITSMALGGNEDVYLTGYRTIGGSKTLLMAAVDHVLFFTKWVQTYNGGFAGDDVGNQVTVGVDGNIYFVGTSTQNPLHGTDIVLIKHPAAPATKASWVSLQHYGNDDNGKFVIVPELDYAYVGGTQGKNVLLYRLNITSMPTPQSPGLYKPIPMTPHSGPLGTLKFNAMKVSTSKKVYVTGSIEANDMSGNTFSAMFLAKYSIVFGNVLSLAYESGCRGSFIENYKGVALSLDYGKSDIYMVCDEWNNYSTHQEEYSQLYDMDVSSPLREAGSIQTTKVNVYPNPASDYIQVNSNIPVMKMEITDLTGQIVRSFDAVENDNSIYVGDLPNGLYMCRMVLEDNSVKYHKLLID